MGMKEIAANVARNMTSPVQAQDSAAGIKANADNIKQYMDATSGASPTPKAETVNSPADRIHPKSKFGDQPNEKRIDVSTMTKPLASYKNGTPRVPKTGTYKLHEGEAVVPAKDNPMAGMFDKIPGAAPKKAKKEIDHIKIRKMKTGGHIVEHHHTHPGDHPMEEHGAATMDKLHDHVEAAMGTPNEGEDGSNSPAASGMSASEASGVE